MSERKHNISDINLEIGNIKCFFNDNHEGIILEWDSNIGFGTYTIYKDREKGEWHADSETMDCNEDKAFITELFRQFVEQLNIRS